MNLQYHQAHETPFGSGPLVQVVGKTGSTTGARDILQGIVPSTITSALLLPSETHRIITSLGAPTPSLNQRLQKSHPKSSDRHTALLGKAPPPLHPADM
jgi:hypothetical protein